MVGTIPIALRENGLTPKQAGGYFSRLKREHNSRWRITFSIKGDHRKGSQTYRKGSWPILFLNEKAAWDAIAVLGAFKNSKATENRGRIISCTVERVRLR